VKLLLIDGMTYSIVAFAAIGTNCAENTIPQLLFTGRCLVTASCCDSTVLALSGYASIQIMNLGNVDGNGRGRIKCSIAAFT
jgi:hypothetical protein